MGWHWFTIKWVDESICEEVNVGFVVIEADEIEDSVKVVVLVGDILNEAPGDTDSVEIDVYESICDGVNVGFVVIEADEIGDADILVLPVGDRLNEASGDDDVL